MNSQGVNYSYLLLSMLAQELMLVALMCCCSSKDCSSASSFQNSLLFSPGEIIITAVLAEVWQVCIQQYILTSIEWAQQYLCLNSLVTNVVCHKNTRKEPEPKSTACLPVLHRNSSRCSKSTLQCKCRDTTFS